jgi:hypothetical protein
MADNGRSGRYANLEPYPQKGEIRNPNGRPKGRVYSEWIRKIFQTPAHKLLGTGAKEQIKLLAKVLDIKPDEVTAGTVFALRDVMLWYNGDRFAAERVLSRIDPQPHKITLTDGDGESVFRQVAFDIEKVCSAPTPDELPKLVDPPLSSDNGKGNNRGNGKRTDNQ